MAEQVAREFAASGLPVVIVNPTTPIGAGDIKPTPTGKIILDFIRGRLPAYVDTGLNLVPVEDVAGRFLMERFHRVLLGNGGDKAAALREAQLATMEALRDGRLPSRRGEPLRDRCSRAPEGRRPERPGRIGPWTWRFSTTFRTIRSPSLAAAGPGFSRVSIVSCRPSRKGVCTMVNR